MMSNIERIKSKINKLLTLAAGTSNKHESQNATAKALAFMQVYRLSHGDLDKPEMKTIEFNHTKVRIPKAESLLATLLAKSMGVYVAFRQGCMGIKGVFYYTGTDSDIEISRFVYDVALRQILIKTKAFRKLYPHVSQGIVNDYKEGLCTGFAVIFSQEYSPKAEDQPPASGTGLIALNSRYTQAKAFGGEEVEPDKRKLNSGVAVAMGYSDSKSITINKGVEGADGQKLIGVSA